jgi:hypothetical protein
MGPPIFWTESYMKKLFLVAALSIGAAGLSGCSEKAQQETSEAGAAVGDDVQGAATAASGAAEEAGAVAADAGKKAQGAVEAAKTEAGKAIEAAGEAADKAGEKMQN